MLTYHCYVSPSIGVGCHRAVSANHKRCSDNTQQPVSSCPHQHFSHNLPIQIGQRERWEGGREGERGAESGERGAGRGQDMGTLGPGGGGEIGHDSSANILSSFPDPIRCISYLDLLFSTQTCISDLASTGPYTSHVNLYHWSNCSLTQGRPLQLLPLLQDAVVSIFSKKNQV